MYLLQTGTKFFPIAALHRIIYRRSHLIAEQHQRHFGIADGAEIAVEQRQFLLQIPPGSRSGRIPQQGDLARPRLGHFADLRGDGQVKIALAVDVLHEQARLPGRLGQGEGQLAIGKIILIVRLRQVGFPPALEAEIGHLVRAVPGRLHRLLEHLHPQRELPHRLFELQRQQVERAGISMLQFLLVGHQQALMAFGGNRVDARFKIIPPGAFQQAGIDLPAHHRLKHLAPFIFFHHYPLAQIAVHLHGKAGDALPFPEGEIKIAFQHPVEIVIKDHLHSGGGEVAVHLHIDAQGFQAQRPLRAAAIGFDEDGRGLLPGQG